MTLPIARPRTAGPRLKPKPVTPRAPLAIHDLTRQQTLQGKSDAELIDAAGYEHNTLSRWRRGVSDASLQTLVDFAQTLGCEVRVVPIGHVPKE